MAPPRPVLCGALFVNADTFADALSRRCGAHYRLRWSPTKDLWMVEQKVARALEVPADGDPDITARVRDGYGLVMQFSPVPYMFCPECRSRLDLPHLQIGEVRCDYCRIRPSTHDNQMWFTGYFPLCEKLLLYLEKTAPKREGRWRAEVETQNHQLAAAAESRYANTTDAIARSYWGQVVGNLTVGYGSGPASFGR